MMRTVLKSKIHRVTVTGSELGYEGSCAIDCDLLYDAGIRQYEQIHIYNVNNGERFTTYAIDADAGSGIISVNGAAARLAQVGDILIICAYGIANSDEWIQPKVVYVDGNNKKTFDKVNDNDKVARG